MKRSTGVMPQQATTSTDWIRLLSRCSATRKGMASWKMAFSSSWLSPGRKLASLGASGMSCASQPFPCGSCLPFCSPWPLADPAGTAQPQAGLQRPAPAPAALNLRGGAAADRPLSERVHVCLGRHCPCEGRSTLPSPPGRLQPWPRCRCAQAAARNRRQPVALACARGLLEQAAQIVHHLCVPRSLALSDHGQQRILPARPALPDRLAHHLLRSQQRLAASTSCLDGASAHAHLFKRAAAPRGCAVQQAARPGARSRGRTEPARAAVGCADGRAGRAL